MVYFCTLVGNFRERRHGGQGERSVNTAKVSHLCSRMKIPLRSRFLLSYPDGCRQVPNTNREQEECLFPLSSTTSQPGAIRNEAQDVLNFEREHLGKESDFPAQFRSVSVAHYKMN